jgi:hypothetical protein
MLGEKNTDLYSSGYFWFSFECSACASWPMVSGADGNALNFVVVSAVQAESFMHVVWVHACVFGFEFLAAHRGSMVHGAQGDAFNVSSVFKVCAVSAAFYVHSLTPMFTDYPCMLHISELVIRIKVFLHKNGTNVQFIQDKTSEKQTLSEHVFQWNAYIISVRVLHRGQQ